MKRGFANIFVFLCSKCEHAISIAKNTPVKQGREDFAGQVMNSTCPYCHHSEPFLADEAGGFQSVEWSFETRSEPRKRNM
jgi:hypothetical protein